MQEMADIYAACAGIGLHKAAIDEMELWEVAASLGLGREQPDAAPGGPLAGRDLIAERVKAAREGRPPPTLQPPIRQASA